MSLSGGSSNSLRMLSADFDKQRPRNRVHSSSCCSSQHSGSCNSSFLNSSYRGTSLTHMETVMQSPEENDDTEEGGVPLTKQQQQQQQQRNPRDHSDHSSQWEPLSASAAATASQSVARKETRAVRWLRTVTLAVLALSTIGVALIVYFYIRRNEKTNFEKAFETDAEKVFEALSTSLFLTLGAVDSVLVSLVSLARFTNQSWPFVTIPDYAVRLSKVRSQSKAVVVQQSHFVTLEQRSDWERYTLEQDDWVTESLAVQQTDPNFDGLPIFTNFTPDGVIHSFMGPSTGDGPFLPTWQSSPVIPVFSAYNWNALDYTSVSEAYDALVQGQRVVISKVSNLADPTSPLSVAETQAAVQYISDFVGPDTDPTEPFSVINFPILDAAGDRVAIFDQEPDGPNNDTSQVLGVVTVMFFWRHLLQDIIPNQDGVICVFRNECNQVFSYMVNGPEVVYLGATDAHDDRYSTYLHAIDLVDLVDYSPTAMAYTGIPLTGSVCGYTLRVYPSERFQNEFTTNHPVVFSATAVAIFIFCFVVFVLYDTCVERRQRKVLSSALRSKENVALLETMVTERTRKLRESNARLEDANDRVVQASAAQLEHFACMSHEIRTPLNCIIGLSSLLMESELNAMQEESMRMIVNSGDLLLTVVNDILDYSRVESGNIEVVVKRSNLQESIGAVIQSIETKARPKNLTVRTLLDPRVCEFVEMDTRRLQQILYNLLGNAVRFSYPNVPIELAVKLIRKPHAARMSSSASSTSSNGSHVGELTPSDVDTADTTSDRSTVFDGSSSAAAATTTITEAAYTHIRFAVKNFGQGIEQRDFDRIFQPFRQANSETERVYGGTGLGLAICAKIVAKMNGSISVDSKEGEWAEFTVDLPFGDTPVDLDNISRVLKNTEIMLVHDDVQAAKDLRLIFDEVGTSFSHFETIDALKEFADSEDSKMEADLYLCLVHEDAYRADVMDAVAAKARTALVTFGPKYSVPESTWHFRSLLHQLPSVMLQQLVRYTTKSRELSVSMSNIQTPSPTSRGSFAARRSLRSSFTQRVTDMSVLIVEDNRINQKVLQRLLSSAVGLKDIDIVENGKLAVGKESEKEYDVIFMDYQMPVMDGIEATKLITRRDDVGHPIPTIAFLTAHAAEEFEKQALDAGASYFLTKPFSKDDIVEFFRLLPIIQKQSISMRELQNQED